MMSSANEELRIAKTVTPKMAELQRILGLQTHSKSLLPPVRRVTSHTVPPNDSFSCQTRLRTCILTRDHQQDETVSWHNDSLSCYPVGESPTTRDAQIHCQ